MAEVTAHAPGTFCWIEAGSTDIGVSCDFYAALFGWEVDERPVPDAGTYIRFLKRGKPVAGMYPLDTAQQTIGMPSHWISYVSVEDAAATLEKAVEGGATPLGRVIDVPGVVVVAEFVDPTGAVCGFWQSKGHIGAAYINEPGTLIWNELWTNDPTAAAAFYCSLFGWAEEVQEMPAGLYRFFRDGDALRGGMMRISPEMGEVSPSWSAHIAVGDLDASIEKVAELGGSVEGEVIDVSGVGRRAVVWDPTGVRFMFMEPARQD
jgi:predicted enzyme related to lactoylglutathione lyase